MKILVLSCDNNADTFEPFHHCMEKYWPDHPPVIYKTETITNPYYETIPIKFEMSLWTMGIRKALDKIDDKRLLVMVDDCFIRQPVDTKRVEYACKNLTGNIACFNFEKSFDKLDLPCQFDGFKKRQHGRPYEVSIMCGLWDKDKLKRVLAINTSPWGVERVQYTCGFDYYINSGDFIIDWGYNYGVWTGLCKGKWCKNMVPFFESEGIEIDWSKRGFLEK